jgi:hypothetical protein
VGNGFIRTLEVHNHSLKELSVEDRKQGGFGSMSAMVREAIDDYISSKKKK